MLSVRWPCVPAPKSRDNPGILIPSSSVVCTAESYGFSWLGGPRAVFLSNQFISAALHVYIKSGIASLGLRKSPGPVLRTRRSDSTLIGHISSGVCTMKILPRFKAPLRSSSTRPRTTRRLRLSVEAMEERIALASPNWTAITRLRSKSARPTTRKQGRRFRSRSLHCRG